MATFLDISLSQTSKINVKTAASCLTAILNQHFFLMSRNSSSSNNQEPYDSKRSFNLLKLFNGLITFLKFITSVKLKYRKKPKTAMAADTTAQTEDTAKADETSEAKTEELKTIGEKPEKETEGVLDVKLKNLTGKVVTGFAVKNEKDEKYPENFLKEDDKFAADEERELWSKLAEISAFKART